MTSKGSAKEKRLKLKSSKWNAEIWEVFIKIIYLIYSNIYWNTVWCFLKNIKNRTTLWSSSLTSGYISKGNENRISKKYLHPLVHCSIIYNGNNLCPSMDEWINKMWKCMCVYIYIYIYICKKEYYLAMRKKEILLFVTTWVHLQGIHYLKWNKPDWKRQIRTAWYHLYVESFWKKSQTQRNRE